MTELQKVEFEMLKHFVEICNKLNLRYFLVCGSALGAVKYKGFIPWDDDIDVALPREDYEVFIKEGQKYLPENIFIQNHKTDKNFPLLGAKMRNSNTTYIESALNKVDMNHGVFVDVFPLDGCPEDDGEINNLCKIEQKYIRRKAVKLTYHRFSGRNLLGFRTILVYLLYRISGLYSNTYKYVCEMENAISKYNTKDTTVWCNYADYIPNKKYQPKEYYGNGIEAEFEGLNVIIPEKYDEYLTQRYGDWQADLPEEEKIGHHYYDICDLNKSYKFYTKNNK